MEKFGNFTKFGIGWRCGSVVVNINSIVQLLNVGRHIHRTDTLHSSALTCTDQHHDNCYVLVVRILAPFNLSRLFFLLDPVALSQLTLTRMLWTLSTAPATDEIARPQL